MPACAGMTEKGSGKSPRGEARRPSLSKHGGRHTTMRRRHIGWALAGLLLAAGMAVSLPFSIPPAAAAKMAPAALGPDERGDVARIEAYLNGITTMKARFLQTNPDGGIARGTVYLHRPGRLLFEYDPPVPVKLVVNQGWLVHVDKKLEHSTYLPLSETPIYFLVRESVSFGDGVTITGFERNPGVLRIRLVKTAAPEMGSVVLTFSNNPLQLRNWSVTDAEGKTTNVALANPQFGVPIDDSLFRFVDPYRSPEGG